MSATAATRLREWLSYPRSITQHLKETSGDAVIEVLSQKMHEYPPVGNISYRFWCREVLISSHGQPCWYGRTHVPDSTYILSQDFFSLLQASNLGRLIFDLGLVERTALFYYPISKIASEYQWLPSHVKSVDNPVLWTRSSQFLLPNQCRFSLCEIFLPGLLRVCE